MGAVAVAVPLPVAQSEVRDLAETIFPAQRGSRYLQVFDNAGIDQRTLVRPLEWYESAHPLAERAAMAMGEGGRLGREAGAAVLAASGLAPDEVDALVVASSTVLRAPGVDVDIAAGLGLRPSVRRVQLFGLASLGGVAALAVAADLVRAGHGKVLVVATEVNSATFVPDDDSVGSLVTMALFSDGAAAALVADDRGALALHGAHTSLVPDTLGVMGFDQVDTGLRWHLAPEVPDVARSHTADSVDAALASVGWDRGSLDHVLLHPGGVKVLAACAEVLDLPDGSLDRSYAVLADHGNLSSATALAVLAGFVADGPPSGRALLTAMGPGFAFEHVLASAVA